MGESFINHLNKHRNNLPVLESPRRLQFSPSAGYFVIIKIPTSSRVVNYAINYAINDVINSIGGRR